MQWSKIKPQIHNQFATKSRKQALLNIKSLSAKGLFVNDFITEHNIDIMFQS